MNKKHSFINRLSNFLPTIVLGAALLVNTGCIKSVEERGYVSQFTDFNNIKQGINTREDVRNLLGSPSTVSDYGPETWFYISTTSESVAFFSPHLIDQKVWYVRFTDAGVVESSGEYTIADARQIKFAKDYTPTEGNDFTITQQLLGNLGRFNPDSASE